MDVERVKQDRLEYYRAYNARRPKVKRVDNRDRSEYKREYYVNVEKGRYHEVRKPAIQKRNQYKKMANTFLEMSLRMIP